MGTQDAPAVPGRPVHGPGSFTAFMVQARGTESIIITSIRAAAQTFPREAEEAARLRGVGLNADEPRAASHRQAGPLRRLQRTTIGVRHAVVRLVGLRRRRAPASTESRRLPVHGQRLLLTSI